MGICYMKLTIKTWKTWKMANLDRRKTWKMTILKPGKRPPKVRGNPVYIHAILYKVSLYIPTEYRNHIHKIVSVCLCIGGD